MKKVKSLYIEILKSENVHLYQTFDIPRNSLKSAEYCFWFFKAKNKGGCALYNTHQWHYLALLIDCFCGFMLKLIE